MSNILISTFFALMAGFLTAAVSFVKLVNDKESRVTDYREEWTNSVRKTLADVVAHVRSLVSLLDTQGVIIGSMQDLSKLIEAESEEDRKKLLQQRLDLQMSRLETTQKEMNSIRRDLNQAYNFARLHFKPNDPLFAIVEQKYDSITSQIKGLSGMPDKEKVAEIRGQIEVYCTELVSVSRAIIKDEWERIKKGEPIYQKTKNVAKWGGVVLFFVLFTIGVHAGISAYFKNENALVSQQLPIAIKSSNCPPERLSNSILTNCDRECDVNGHASLGNVEQHIFINSNPLKEKSPQPNPCNNSLSEQKAPALK